MLWRIYYDDGSTFSSADGEPEDAPGWGVIAINTLREEREPPGCVYGYDYYVFDPTICEWIGVDLTGFLDRSTCPAWRRRTRALLIGRTIGEIQFKQLIQRAASELGEVSR